MHAHTQATVVQKQHSVASTLHKHIHEPNPLSATRTIVNINNSAHPHKQAKPSTEHRNDNITVTVNNSNDKHSTNIEKHVVDEFSQPRTADRTRVITLNNKYAPSGVYVISL